VHYLGDPFYEGGRTLDNGCEEGEDSKRQRENEFGEQGEPLNEEDREKKQRETYTLILSRCKI